MNRTKIEWCDYTVNPVRGYCPMACPYCYARAMYHRFKWDKTIRLDNEVLAQWFLLPEGSRVFVGSTMELFGDWVPEEWLKAILDQVRWHSKATFIFLTKKPENLARWNPWPKNAWVGVSIDRQAAVNNLHHLCHVDAKVRFVSVEPLLEKVFFHGYTVDLPWAGGQSRGGRGYQPVDGFIDWIIIGAQTGAGAITPQPEWVESLLRDAKYRRTPVFLKDNLHWPEKRQEWPAIEH